MSTPCVKFTDLKLIVDGGSNMSHGQIKKVWGRMLMQAGINEHDKLAIAMFSQCILDIHNWLYHWPRYKGRQGFTGDEIVAHAFQYLAPANWVTVVPLDHG